MRGHLVFRMYLNMQIIKKMIKNVKINTKLGNESKARPKKWTLIKK